GISTDVQIRYYTGIDAFNAIRVYFKYGQASYKNRVTTDPETYSDVMAQSVGFETRFYFLNTPLGNVTINPFLKVAFNTSLKGKATDNQVRAGGVGDGTITGGYYSYSYNDYSEKYEWEKSPYDVTVQAVLGITANSDIVTLYVEPSLGYKATYSGKSKYTYTVAGETRTTTSDDPKVIHNLAWGAYTELYIRPVQDLEWY
ncbi:cell surface protein, partial [Brachyspira hampsonii]|nr:cell surface protein [Brachyspira hampsonii]